MPFVYTLELATPGNLTTNATPNTETEAFFVKAGTRNVMLQTVYVIGKGAGLTAISAIAFRLLKWATSSTGGTGITPAPCDAGEQAAKSTAASRPSSGSTRTNGPVFGCGAASPGGYMPPNVDSQLELEGSAAGSISMMDISGTASLPYEWSGEIVE